MAVFDDWGLILLSNVTEKQKKQMKQSDRVLW